MKKVLAIIGTRPEVIKIMPVYQTLKSRGVNIKIALTGQHRDLANQALRSFGVTADIDLKIASQGQSIGQLYSQLLGAIDQLLGDEKPDLVLCHGDTATAACVGLASFLAGVPLGHVEAGLRSYNLESPFPEEFNRQLISKFTDLNFAPTNRELSNLNKENVSGTFVVGNTVIDALNRSFKETTKPARPSIVLTLHRREKGAKDFEDLLKEVNVFAAANPEFDILFPVHPNPTVQAAAHKIFASSTNIELVPPLDYPAFIAKLSQASLVVTDSGGIQEEAAALGVQTIVARDTTERLDGIEVGLTHILGSKRLSDLMSYALSHRQRTLRNISKKSASRMIADLIQQFLAKPQGEGL
jgi:UDP-N-acetylglucosamine 2-epimerase (non-hydrolysing)